MAIAFQPRPATRKLYAGFDYEAQPKETISACNLCGGDFFAVICHKDRYGFPVEAHECQSCGLVFLNPRLTKEAYAAFYEKHYRNLIAEITGKPCNAETIKQGQANYARRLEACLGSFLPSGPSTLLDIGGSTGIVAKHLGIAFGLVPTVLDPAPEELAHSGVEAIPGMLEDYQPDRTFDMVTICRSIDHFLDVRGALVKVRQLLVNGGLFFVDIVDFASERAKAGNQLSQIIKVDHPFYLTKATMLRYLGEASFEPLRLDYAADGRHLGFVCR